MGHGREVFRDFEAERSAARDYIPVIKWRERNKLFFRCDLFDCFILFLPRLSKEKFGIVFTSFFFFVCGMLVFPREESREKDISGPIQSRDRREQ